MFNERKGVRGRCDKPFHCEYLYLTQSIAGGTVVEHLRQCAQVLG